MNNLASLGLFSIVSIFCLSAFNTHSELEFTFDFGYMPEEFSLTISEQHDISIYNTNLKRQASPEPVKYRIEIADNIDAIFQTDLPMNLDSETAMVEFWDETEFSPTDTLDTFDISLTARDRSLPFSDTFFTDDAEFEQAPKEKTEPKEKAALPTRRQPKGQVTKKLDEKKIEDKKNNVPEVKSLKRKTHPTEKNDKKKRQKTSGVKPTIEFKHWSPLPAAAVTLLRQWFSAHSKHPYPSTEEKEELAQRTGLKFTQVNSWFSNERRRNLRDYQLETPPDNNLVVRDVASEETKDESIISDDNLSSEDRVLELDDDRAPRADEKKKRSRLPAQAVNLLRNWFSTHAASPYPSEDEKEILAEKSGLTITQVNTWFTNARRRPLPK